MIRRKIGHNGQVRRSLAGLLFGASFICACLALSGFLLQRSMFSPSDDRETAELSQVDAALRRIEAGVYGLCTDCGVAIPAARLHAAPEAMRCIACQQKAE